MVQLILNNGQSIKGVFEYAYFKFPVCNFKLYSDSGKLIKRYKISEINKVVLAGSDTTLSKKDSTYFIRIGKSSLYRQLTFGAIEIFDPLVNVNESPGLISSNTAVLENNKLKEFYSEKKILKYIENKLKEKGIEKTFKSTKDAIRYLNFSVPVMR
ncbi:MAG TPA: hypothetical protein VMU83_18640 [Hanamia sp.]|nr:hypothetical protein [Hanamia sp.]